MEKKKINQPDKGFTVLPNGNLRIYFRFRRWRADDRELRREMQAFLKDHGREEDFLAEFFESELCNGYHLVDDEQRELIGALTAAPIISDTIIDEEASPEAIRDCNVWWYPNYQLTNAMEEMLRDGYVDFELATSETEETEEAHEQLST